MLKVKNGGKLQMRTKSLDVNTVDYSRVKLRMLHSINVHIYMG